ncbi:lipid-A-disaccharide synthase [Lentisphaerota bacterium WC36G]|nr:lipid-A-disaccharide synthase [Lentisphaerae bacterium WC36]
MKKKLNFWIFSGEASGDIYGAQLIEEISKIAKQNKNDLTIKIMGGPKMQATNKAEVMVDSTELGVVGIFEVLTHIIPFIGIFFKLLKKARKERPDAVVMIDYPFFNLLMAKKFTKLNIPVIWYISPQVWAWKKKRIYKLAKYCQKMLVVFPFETEIYQKTNLETIYVGHPLVDFVRSKLDGSVKREDNKILLLPGSRTSEIKRLLIPMLEAITLFSDQQKEQRFHYFIAAPREKSYNQIMEIYSEFKKNNSNCPDCEIDFGKTTYHQQSASTALAASGTVTVESAIIGLPLVSIYRLHPITFLIARVLVTLYRGYFTMVNIIANKTVFEEFVQHQVTGQALCEALTKIIPNGVRRAEVEKGMKEVTRLLRSDNNENGISAAERTAQECYKVLSGTSDSDVTKY